MIINPIIEELMDKLYLKININVESSWIKSTSILKLVNFGIFFNSCSLRKRCNMKNISNYRGRSFHNNGS